MSIPRTFFIRCDPSEIENVRLICARFSSFDVTVAEHDGEKVWIHVSPGALPMGERDAFVARLVRELETAISLHRVSPR